MSDHEFIDLFSGAGGFSCGFEKAGFTAIAGIDKEESVLQTFGRNHENAEAISHDISEEVIEYDVDLVIGSPPCQGFSVAQGGNRDVDDERNNLVFDYINWINEIQPKVFVMENVAGIRSISEEFLDVVEDKFNKAGYEIVDGVLNSAEFGVPQKRERYFVLGVRNDIEGKAKLPSPTHETSDQIQTKLNGEQMETLNTVGDAFTGLPKTSEDGKVEVNRSDIKQENGYFEFVIDSDNTENHVAKEPRDKEIDIVDNIPEGKVYRSSRFGDQYLGAWEVHSSKFNEEEKKALRFISKNRTRKEYKATDKKYPDYIPSGSVPVEKKILEGLHDNDWLRKKTDHGGHESTYDINTKSGVRPKYKRLSRDGISGTLTTADFKPREKLHPTEDRGLSLREGARIQSFPDSFIFEGSFSDISTQIGNAVPPLLSYKIAKHIKSQGWLD
jgi:DNA (cytosine-5)-methyltransferase 1